MAYHPAASINLVVSHPLGSHDPGRSTVSSDTARRSTEGPEGPVEEHVGEISMARFTGWWLSLPL